MNSPDRSSHDAYIVQGRVSNFLRLVAPGKHLTYAALDHLTGAPLEIRRRFLDERAASLGARACRASEDPRTAALDDIIEAIETPETVDEHTPLKKYNMFQAWLAADGTTPLSETAALESLRITPAIDVQLQRMVDRHSSPH